MAWRVVGTSVRGSGHQKNGLPCQDAHQVELHSSGVLIAAVADGAGSANLADIGAGIAASRSIESICNSIRAALPADDEQWKKVLTQALGHAREAIETEATRRLKRPGDLACTLILLAATPTGVVAAQVGDGAVVLGADGDSLITLTRPRVGEYINETTFLVSADAVQTAQLASWRGRPGAIAVFSDGLQSLALKLPEAAPHAPFFRPLFSFIAQATDTEAARQQLAAFLTSPRITQRTDDDLTLVLAQPVPDEVK